MILLAKKSEFFLETKRLRSESVLMPQQSYEVAANELFDGILNSSGSEEDDDAV